MPSSYPAFAMFPDLNVVIRTPSGGEYRGSFRQHPSTKVEGEHWYEGYLVADHKDRVTADTNLNHAFKRDAQRPDYFHPDSNVEPLRLKLNRIPEEQRNDRNAQALIGELWTHEGLWTVIASPSRSDKLHLAGNVVPSRHEMDFDGSKIRQYQAANRNEAADRQPEKRSAPRRAGLRPG